MPETDQQTVTVHIPVHVADRILTDAGWTIEPVRGGFAYVRPGRTRRCDGGRFGEDYLWEFDEALTEAVPA